MGDFRIFVAADHSRTGHLPSASIWGHFSINMLEENIKTCLYKYRFFATAWDRGAAVGWGTALQDGRPRVQFPMVSVEFFIDIILPAELRPCGRPRLWQKKVPGIFPGGKGGRCVGLTTWTPSCADCLEIWNSQSPGTLRACPGLQCGCFTFLQSTRYKHHNMNHSYVSFKGWKPVFYLSTIQEVPSRKYKTFCIEQISVSTDSFLLFLFYFNL
jgi:hypothetical protein